MTTAQPQVDANSRVGKRPLPLPAGVEIKVAGRTVTAKGPKGSVVREMPADIKIEIKDKVVHVAPAAGSGRQGKQFQALLTSRLT